MEILKSASKIVLLILVVGLVVALFVPYVNDKVLDIFKYVITSVVSFYFGQKVNEILTGSTN